MATGPDERLPIYAELASRLREKIKAGSYKPGDWIGSEYKLAMSESISRMTVRRASKILVQEGLIERRPGKGLFVCDGRRSATRRILVLAGNLQWEPALQAARGVQQCSHDLGVEVFLYDAHGQLEQDLEMLRALPGRGYDGAVIISLHGMAFTKAIYELCRLRFPFVLVDQSLQDIDAPSVTADNYAGGYMVGEHLVGRGHSRLGFLGDTVANTVCDRLSGFRDAIADAGQPLDRRRIIELDASLERLGDWNEQVREGARCLMGLDEPPTAIFASCDAIAREILCVLAAMGCSVPADVSVAGFDDDPLGQWTKPNLTTVRQPFREMGRVALGMLIAQIDAPSEGGAFESRVLPVELVERDSVAPPSSG